MIRKPYTVNGVLYGCFYELHDGRKVFLAHMTPGKLKRGAWAISLFILNECQRLGILYAGVVVREGNRKLYYVTRVSDFFSAESYMHIGKNVERALPAKHFVINPHNCLKAISRRSTIGR